MLYRIGSGWQHERISAGPPDLGRQRPRIRVANLMRQRIGPGLQNLVARGENRHARTPKDGNPQHADRGQYRNFRVSNALAGVQHFAARNCVAAARTHVQSGRQMTIDDNQIAIHAHVLQHDHCVGPCGHGSAGHDLDSVTRLDLAVEKLTGTNFANDGQSSGCVCRAHSEAVAHRAVERRVVPVGVNGRRKNPTSSFPQIDDFDRWQHSQATHRIKDGGAGHCERKRRRHYFGF